MARAGPRRSPRHRRPPRWTAFTLKDASGPLGSDTQVGEKRFWLGAKLFWAAAIEGGFRKGGGTLTVRRGNVIVRTLLPFAKVPQAKLSDAMAAGL